MIHTVEATVDERGIVQLLDISTIFPSRSIHLTHHRPAAAEAAEVDFEI